MVKRPKCPKCDGGKLLPCICIFNCGKPHCKGEKWK